MNIQMRKRNRFIFVTILLWYSGILSANAGVRGIWVTRFDFKNATDVAEIMENAHYLGTSHVFFQIRGNATVCYPSKIEPWAWELTSGSALTTGVDPGWDPLATAIREAKKQKMQIHAWMNVFPGWRGVDPSPKGIQQPWANHRSWFMIDHQGKLLLPTKTFYSFLSPGIPEVRSYLASVSEEIVKLYPNLDGIHLDYVRYPGRTEVGTFRDFSYDAPSVNTYRQQYGKKPSVDQPEWSRFKCDQVNSSILAIRKAMRKVSPYMQLSATCFANIHAATEEKGQDPRDWLEKGLLDWVVPMVYERNTQSFASRLDDWNRAFASQWRSRMWVGINVDFNKEGEIIRQLGAMQNQGYNGALLFAYSSLFPARKPNAKAEAIRSLWQEQSIRDILLKTSPPSSR